MIVAASRWIAISPSLLATSSPAAAGARQDSAVTATAVWMKRRRGRMPRRLRTATSSPPSSAPANVNWANYPSGILPPAARCTPAARIAVAESVVAVAATAATTSVARLSDEVDALATADDMAGFLSGDGRRPMRHLSSSTNDDRVIDSAGQTPLAGSLELATEPALHAPPPAIGMRRQRDVGAAASGPQLLVVLCSGCASQERSRHNPLSLIGRPIERKASATKVRLVCSRS